MYVSGRFQQDFGEFSPRATNQNIIKLLQAWYLALSEQSMHISHSALLLIWYASGQKLAALCPHSLQARQ